MIIFLLLLLTPYLYAEVSLPSVCIQANRPKKEQKPTPVAEALSKKNNVILTRMGHGFESISVRGIAQDALQVFMDGMPIQGGASPIFNLSQLGNDSDVTIETGPLSAQKGLNSFLGALEIETPEAKTKPEASAYTLYKSPRALTKGISASSKHEDFSGTLSFNQVNNYGDYVFAKRLRATNTLLNKTDFLKRDQINSRLDHTKDGWKTSLFMRYSEGYMSYRDIFSANESRAHDEFALVRCLIKRTRGVWQPEFSYGVTESKRKDITFSNDRYEAKTKRSYAQMDHAFVLDNNQTLHLKVSTLQDDFNSESDFSSARNKKTIGQLSSGYKLTVDKTSFETWVSYEKNVNLQGKIKQKISDSLSIFIKGGKSSRTPTLLQLYDARSGNRLLKQESATGGDIGYNLTQSQHSLKQAIFGYFVKDKISSALNSLGRTVYLNKDKVRIYGGETTYAYKFNRWRLDVGHMYCGTKDNTGNKLVKTPLHKVDIGLTQEFLDGEAKISLSHMSGYREQAQIGEPLQKRPNITTLNFETTYTINKNWTFYGGVDNIFNEAYEFPLNYAAGGLHIFAGFKVKT